MKKKNNILKFLTILILIFSYIYLCSILSVPKNIVIFEGDNLNLKIAKGLSLNSANKQTVLTASNINKEKINQTGVNRLNLNLFGNIKVKDVNISVIPKTTVIPLGNAIGMKLYTKGVLVVGMSEIKGEDGITYKPYENTGIEQGDAITKINDEEINTTEE